MAYRRRQGLSRSSTFNEGILHPRDQDDTTTSSAAAAPSSPLAPSQPNRASDPRLHSFQSSGAFHASFKNRTKSGFVEKKGSATYDYTSMKSTNEPGGFWGVIARKAKSILDNGSPKQSNAHIYSSPKPEAVSFSTSNQFNGIQFEHTKKLEGAPRLKIQGLDTVTSCPLNQIGETIGNALEEGKIKSMRDKKSDQDMMMQNRRSSRAKNNEEKKQEMDPETQLKVSRDVAIATAAKAKVLLRELKGLKAELDSAKKRCCELEEENKMLREVNEKGDHHAHDDDDDMIRIQLEMLLAEKGRLAHENSVYARENRHLREIIEFHQLSMQDLVYWDDVTQDVQIDLSTPASVSASDWSRPTDTSQRPRLTTSKSA